MKKSVVVLAAVTVAISVIAVNQWLRLHEMREKSAPLRERVTELQSVQLATAMARGMPAAAAAPGTPDAQATGQPLTAVQGPVGAREKRSENTSAGGITQMFATPEGREILRMQVRMNLPRRYPDLAKELGLTTAQEEKLFDLLAKQQFDKAADSLGAMNGETIDGATLQERQRKAQEKQRTDEAELTAMLGSKYSQYQEYQKALPSRQQVNQLQSTLGAGNNALTDSQSKPLIAALSAEQARIQEDRRNAPRPAPSAANPQNFLEQQQQRAAEDNRRLVSVASSHLNPQQLESYRRMLARQENPQRAVLLGTAMPVSSP